LSVLLSYGGVINDGLETIGVTRRWLYHAYGQFKLTD
jgi:hypothetical protein